MQKPGSMRLHIILRNEGHQSEFYEVDSRHRSRLRMRPGHLEFKVHIGLVFFLHFLVCIFSFHQSKDTKKCGEPSSPLCGDLFIGRLGEDKISSGRCFDKPVPAARKIGQRVLEMLLLFLPGSLYIPAIFQARFLPAEAATFLFRHRTNPITRPITSRVRLQIISQGERPQATSASPTASEPGAAPVR